MPVWSKVTAGIAAEPTSGGARAQLSPWRAGAGANTAGRLGADEVVPIEHRNGLSGTRLEPREVLRGVACVNGLRGSGRGCAEAGCSNLEVGDRVDAAAADGVVVAGDRADEDAARILSARQVRQEKTDHEEVAEVVDLHLLLVSVQAPLGVRQRGLIHLRVTAANSCAVEGRAPAGTPGTGA